MRDQRDGPFAFLTESSPDAIIGLTIEGLVSSWNAGAEHLFGFLPGEVIGHPVQRVLKLDDNALARVAARERVPMFESRGTGKDGADLALTISLAPIPDENEEITGALLIARGMRRGLEHLQQLAEIT